LCIFACDTPFIIENKIKDDFNNKFKLIAGKETFEGNENKIISAFCKIAKPDSKKVIKHVIKEISKNKEYKCDNCNKEFSVKKNLDYHNEKKVCIDKKHSCKYCGHKFNSNISMYRHIRTVCNNNTSHEKIFERIMKLEEDVKKNKQLEKKIINLENILKKITVNNNSET
jgi:DNA-directed RNA polymerase subunit RPC12/RpoP